MTLSLNLNYSHAMRLRFTISIDALMYDSQSEPELFSYEVLVNNQQNISVVQTLSTVFFKVPKSDNQWILCLNLDLETVQHLVYA